MSEINECVRNNLTRFLHQNLKDLTTERLVLAIQEASRKGGGLRRPSRHRATWNAIGKSWLNFGHAIGNRLRVSGRGTARAEDAQGTPT